MCCLMIIHISCSVNRLQGLLNFFFFFFKQKTAYEMRISDWSSDVCSSDLLTSLETGHLLHLGDLVQFRAHTLENLGAELLVGHLAAAEAQCEIGRASCRERECQYV